ncbi:hypothetical protein EMIHUDRAFT_216690 [Emiliania huxleyi CCMP1516]|uniref:Uncharacterized protein n=2 Tax=Emiliania huxleyi TaxID=2903 RepID=A0A0D3IDF9_EMIH1|nr:hypothetical protein EMIHUDRAFT_220876 [Emiliania huxleyi CCMP1516]XP_005761723.1 hypothetical protein EMIHUDRAFT_216690 [Emiliania huxleyi CCMP1516]EOD04733.1 hypothetical protein EMIHUDRAFT_220876 [Emiliania huxleyi CCMP1516]EOD09294.1 hypothetical protein EMIHUDRAFT_216690 [Emiliania huxleyi CCMP1516]|eukprot:XP_005757162.1 hypothetical protein EMIHUDRAFT_220876 [Emiliania huxleyi CCMP1516]
MPGFFPASPATMQATRGLAWQPKITCSQRLWIVIMAVAAVGALVIIGVTLPFGVATGGEKSDPPSWFVPMLAVGGGLAAFVMAAATAIFCRDAMCGVGHESTIRRTVAAMEAGEVATAETVESEATPGCNNPPSSVAAKPSECES